MPSPFALLLSRRARWNRTPCPSASPCSIRWVAVCVFQASRCSQTASVTGERPAWVRHISAQCSAQVPHAPSADIVRSAQPSQLQVHMANACTTCSATFVLKADISAFLRNRVYRHAGEHEASRCYAGAFRPYTGDRHLTGGFAGCSNIAACIGVLCSRSALRLL